MSFVIENAKLSRSGLDFIDEDRLHGLLDAGPAPAEVREIIAKSMAKQPLSVEETAVLLAADGPELRRGDLRRRPAIETRRLRQPHRDVRPAVRRQRLHQRLPVLRVPPLEPGGGPPHAGRGRASPAGAGPGGQGAQAADPGLRRASPLQPRVHGRVRAARSTPPRAATAKSAA